MKKVVYILLTTIICFFVLPTSTKASAPTNIYMISYMAGPDVKYQVNEFERGQTYYFSVFNTRGFFYSFDGIYEFEFDENVFEFEHVTSDYNFKYENGKLIMGFDKDEFKKKLINEDILVYTVMLKVKDNAKIGHTKVNRLSYEIVCSDTDIQNGVEGCTPNEEIKEDNEEKNEVDNTLNNNTDNNSNNAMENSSNKNIILDDIKFYILAGLICVTIIEMLVLIIRSGKKIN